MCVMEKIEALTAALPDLPDGKVDFAASLIKQAKGKKPLSEKQLFWVDKLIALSEPQPALQIDGDLSGVLSLFAVATEHGMKRPKIRLALPDGTKVSLSLAPAHGKNAGFVYAKLDGEYRGKISPEGAFTPYQLDEAHKAPLLALLGDLARDPVSVALAYGKMTGACCFCSKDLTDDRSVAAGYGPTCAEHYGLPWGEDK